MIQTFSSSISSPKKWSVKKFGGTSLKDPKCIANVARLLASSWHSGERFAVVVSAMAGTTNSLVAFYQDIQQQISSQESFHQTEDIFKEQLYERDTILAAGEQINAGLLALALQCMGLSSRSLLSWQIPIYTNNHPTNAEIQHIDTEKIESLLEQGVIPIIAGFQGITRNNRLTTLGRGGSDTTAVALSAFLKAKTCDIYTDVRGIYTADPSYVAGAQQLRDISYEDMLFLAQGGAKVMHPHGVYWAKTHNIDVRILSTFDPEDPGTLIHQTNYKVWGVAKKTLLHWTVENLTIEELNLCCKNLNSFWTIDMRKKKNSYNDLWTLCFCSHGESRETIGLFFSKPPTIQPINFITVLSPWSTEDVVLIHPDHNKKNNSKIYQKNYNSYNNNSYNNEIILHNENLTAEKEKIGFLFGHPLRYFPLNCGQGFGFFVKPEESDSFIKRLHTYLVQAEKKAKNYIN